MSITSGIGLVSGIDTVSLIEQLLAIDSQAKVPIFQRISSLTAAKNLCQRPLPGSILSTTSFGEKTSLR